jgi:hypothetical protein
MHDFLAQFTDFFCMANSFELARLQQALFKMVS